MLNLVSGEKILWSFKIVRGGKNIDMIFRLDAIIFQLRYESLNVKKLTYYRKLLT